eukprot:s6477_g1.t1
MLSSWCLEVLTGTPVEAFLIVISVGLVAYALGAPDTNSSGSVLVPMNFISGSMFQPELMVIMTGVFFAATAPASELHEVEKVMGGVWIFGQLILFSMIGSRTTLDIFPAFWHHVFPMMAFGLGARFLGIFLAINGILTLGLPGHPFQESMVTIDSTFCFLSVLPRATIQGALGQVPITEQFFGRLPNSSTCQEFIFLAARLYICIMSVVGMILLNTLGPGLVEQTLERPDWGGEQKDALNVEKGKQSDSGPKQEHIEAPEEEDDRLLQTLSEAYKIPESVLQDALQRAMQNQSTLQMKAASQPAIGQGKAGLDASDLAFAQFDCLGSVLKTSESQEGQTSLKLTIKRPIAVRTLLQNFGMQSESARQSWRATAGIRRPLERLKFELVHWRQISKQAEAELEAAKTSRSKVEEELALEEQEAVASSGELQTRSDSGTPPALIVLSCAVPESIPKCLGAQTSWEFWRLFQSDFGRKGFFKEVQRLHYTESCKVLT